MTTRKGKFQGFVAGVLFMTMLVPAVGVFANTVVRELAFGIRIQIDGVHLNLDEESRPFVMDGRTFLPVRAIADAVGKDVFWDAPTQTVHLYSRTGTGLDVVYTPLPQPTPVPTTARTYLEVDIQGRSGWGSSVTGGAGVHRHPQNGTFTMSGDIFLSGLSQTGAHHGDHHATYDIAGRGYTLFTGTIGMVDGHEGGNFLITADGRPLANFTLTPGERPMQVTVPLPAGALEFRIRFEPEGRTRLALGNAFFS
ncbi:MAG: copper amine oxidase N-terminal domain-containing protein [Defluviitaleaceae bacterium]|nr:copper amine oxidase N-terminal domain-containing protein [Defluviitaleaceae bacterium]MCL2262267.1 copper amine oxidase N-terminal domain-containing protein [Defluviitaleaceae bacterium]